MFTIKEVALILKVTEMTVFRHIHSGKIKAIKVGKSWRINESEIKRIKRCGI